MNDFDRKLLQQMLILFALASGTMFAGHLAGVGVSGRCVL